MQGNAQITRKSFVSWLGIVLRKYLSVVLTLCVGVGLSVVIFVAMYSWKTHDIEHEFIEAAKLRDLAISNAIAEKVLVLEALGSFFDCSNKVERGEFEIFAKTFLSRVPGIQALEWIPKVSPAQRDEFKAAATKDGLSHYKITERSPDGSMVSTKPRDIYYPVYFVEPYEGNTAALGYDLASNPTRLAGLDRSRDTGEIIATARITLIQEIQGQFGFLIFRPVYHKSSSPGICKNNSEELQGFVLGVFRIGDTIESAMKTLEPKSEIEVSLYDLSTQSDGELLGSYACSDTNESISNLTKYKARHKHTVESNIRFAGREWVVVCAPTAKFFTSRRTFEPWAGMAIGLLLTGFLVAYFTITTGRTEKVRALVDQRTGQLADANKELHQAHHRERDVAAKIQQLLLLGTIPKDFPELDVAAITVASKQVDGDFYDFIRYDDRHLDIFIGDVMGKGVPAALVGAAVKSNLQLAFGRLVGNLPTGELPQIEDIVRFVHTNLCQRLITLETFVTLCYCRFDMLERRVDFVDCGHTKTIHYRADSGTCELLETKNLPLGVAPWEVYRQGSVSLGAGDELLFYSDGVTEAMNAKKDLFGVDRLKKIMKDKLHTSASELVGNVCDAVSEYSYENKFADDLTCLAVRVAPAPIHHREVQAPWEISSDPDDLTWLRGYVQETCSKVTNANREDILRFELAVNEVASNIMHHAYNYDTNRRIRLESVVHNSKVELWMYHWGKEFTPPNEPLPLPGTDQVDGFGLFIIQQGVDSISYSRDEKGKNCIYITKEFQPVYQGVT